MMRIAQQPTACDAFHAHASRSGQQRNLILAHIKKCGGDWSIGELAQVMNLQKSTVSARVNELLYVTGELIERPKRKDRVSGICVRPVGLPRTGQQKLWE